MKLFNFFPPIRDEVKPSHDDKALSGLHSGNIGDIIYALATAKTLKISHLILNLCSDPFFGGRILGIESVDALMPLLLAQPWITRVTVIKTNIPFDYANPTELGVDYILDSFRAHAQDPKMHLIYMHALPFKANLNVSEPWLEAPRTGAQKEPYLTINLTPRVRTLSHQYYEELLFGFPAEQIFWIGLPKEQIERRNIQGNTVHSTNFLDLAALIQNSALFIGNSSFPYALAEGLKVKRLVETPENNVVYPLDASGLVLAEMSMKQARAKIADALQAPLIDSSIRITADTQRDIILLHEALVDAHHMSVKRGVSMIVQSILSKLGVYDFFKRISDAVATKKD